MEGVQETLDLLGYDFRNVPFYWYAAFMAATCLVLYVAEELRKCGFSGRISGIISAFSAYWLDSGYIYGVSPRGFGTSHIFFVKVNSSPVVNFVLSLFVNRDSLHSAYCAKAGDSTAQFLVGR